MAYADYLGYCATMDADGRWVNAECSDDHNFVCKKKTGGEWLDIPDALLTKQQYQPNSER